MLNIAVFFQKYGDTSWGRILRRKWEGIPRRNNARIKYLRNAGAHIGEGCFIPTIHTLGSEPYLVKIGNNVYFSGDNQLITHDGAIMQLKHMGYTDKFYDCLSPIEIGDNCFIGHGSKILKGVTLGKNCIVGAGAIVTKDFPDNCVIVGVPAKQISTTTDFYEKNKNLFIDTFGMSRYKKRLIAEGKFKL